MEMFRSLIDFSFVCEDKLVQVKVIKEIRECKVYNTRHSLSGKHCGVVLENCLEMPSRLQ